MSEEHDTPDFAAMEEERRRVVSGLLISLVICVALVSFLYLLHTVFK